MILGGGILFSFSAHGQTAGTVQGVVVDAETEVPLVGATLILMPDEIGTTTDLDGRYKFSNVAAGSYTLRVSYIGFKTRFIPDVIVRPGRATQSNVSLQPAIFEGEEIVVSAGYFDEVDQEPTSMTTYSAEEIRRAAGAGGDISRIISSLPSLAKVNDQQNSLVVRGGNPMENAFYVDNIEIPNINHFPTQGSSGGPIGLINVDLIEDVEFSAGGFSAAYGNRLSSMMRLGLREGNREKTEAQFDFNFAGVGVVAEGGLSKGKGSWLFSARRSYLDFLVNTVFKDEAGAALPVYSDYQLKVVYDVGKRSRFSLLNVSGIDKSEIKLDDAIKEGENYFGNWENTEQTTGVNWRYLWKNAGVSHTSLSFSSSSYDISTARVATERVFYANGSKENHLRLRNTNFFQLSDKTEIDFGADLDVAFSKFNHFYEGEIDPLGQPVAGLDVEDKPESARMGVYTSLQWQPAWRYTINAGVRLDHFTFTGHTDFSPRLSLSYQVTPRTTLNLATGKYAQHLPMVLLSQDKSYSDLKNPEVWQWVAGVKHSLSDDTRLTVEGYYKSYKNFPVNPAQPGLFIIDQLFYQQDGYLNHDALLDSGRAKAKGIEVTVQKKLADKLYGLVSGALFSTQYRALDGKWRDRVFDNRYLFAVEGGYKPGGKNEFSIKWIYAGGRPYTPFDQSASQAANRGIFDATKINAERMPAYHSLNLRYDRRFYFKRTSMIAFLSIWNVYGRRNTAAFTWDEVNNRQDVIEQWSTLPIFGLEIEL